MGDLLFPLFLFMIPKFGRIDYFHYLCSTLNILLYDETDQRRIQREAGAAVRAVHHALYDAVYWWYEYGICEMR